MYLLYGMRKPQQVCFIGFFVEKKLFSFIESLLVHLKGRYQNIWFLGSLVINASFPLKENWGRKTFKCPGVANCIGKFCNEDMETYGKRKLARQ